VLESVFSERQRSWSRNFPFGVLFTVEGDTILIIAVMHLRRNPASWLKRRRNH
jgi:toxin ParE1/3/4